MTSTPTDPVNVYRQARAILAIRGWTHGMKDGQRTCLIGAMALALDDCDLDENTPYDVADPHCDLLADVIAEQYPDWVTALHPMDKLEPMTVVFRFNDQHTEGEVLAVLEKAAVRAEESATP